MRVQQYGFKPAKRVGLGTLSQTSMGPVNPLYHTYSVGSSGSTTGSLGTTYGVGAGLGGTAGYSLLNPQGSQSASYGTGKGLGGAAGFSMLNPPTPPKPAAPSAGGDSDNGQQPGSPGNTFNLPDLSSDPVLASIRALGDKSVAEAQAGALSAKERALIQFGDSGLAQKLLGDTNTATAAGQNPTSTLAQLLRQHNQNTTGINQAENADNLFYSSDRANKLGQEGQDYLGAQANAQNALYDLLSQADQAVQTARDNAQAQYEAGLPDAYNRFLQFAEQNGGAPDTTPPPPPQGSPAPAAGGLPASVESPGSFGPGSGLLGQPSLMSLFKAQPQPKPRGGRKIAS